jgi:hypothetical protein
MDDIDNSGLRHRGVIPDTKSDTINTVETKAEKASTSQGTVIKASIDNNPVIVRQYRSLLNPVTGKTELVWFSPAVPYIDSVEVIEQKEAEPVNLATLLSESLRPLNVINIGVYLGLLFGYAAPNGLRSPAFMFAAGQFYENGKSLAPLS